MSRKVVASPEAMMQSLFWPEVNLRSASEFTIKKFSQNSVIRPKFLFKNSTSVDFTTLPSDIPADLEDKEYVCGIMYYFNCRTREPSSSQVFPVVLLITALPFPPAMYFTALNSGSMSWSTWQKVSTTAVT